MATIEEVSHLAKVSTATISRVINNSGPVHAQTRNRVLKAIEELGYKPNPMARGLALNRSGGIGVSIGSLGSPYFGQLLMGTEQVITASGRHLLVSTGNSDAKLEQASVRFLTERQADALIVHTDDTSDETLISWAAGPVPLVIFGRYISELADSCIYLDNESGGYLATKHLLDNGHRQVAHIAGPLDAQDSRARLHGYRRAVEQAGLAFAEDLVVEADFAEDGGSRAVHRLLNRNLRPSAIFAANDQMAVGAMRALYELGLRVPDDVSLVGYDDVVFAAFLVPGLTTVRQPLFEMGQAAAHLALRKLGQKEPEVKQKFEPELVLRQSVKSVS
jgi:LacI family transcriptional regulator